MYPFPLLSASSISSVWSMEGFDEEEESDNESDMTTTANDERIDPNSLTDQPAKENTPIIIISSA